VIWTGVTDDNTCIKYLESVLQATFIGISYSTANGTITVYEYDTIRIGTLAHAFLSACFISRSAIFRSGPHGRGDCLPPFSALCASLGSFLKRTAAITQAGAGRQTLRSGTVAFNLCLAPLKSRIYLHQQRRLP